MERKVSNHIFTGKDNQDKLTLRSYDVFGFTLGVFVDTADSISYGNEGSRMVSLSLDEAKNMRDLLDIAITDYEENL